MTDNPDTRPKEGAAIPVSDIRTPLSYSTKARRHLVL